MSAAGMDKARRDDAAVLDHWASFAAGLRARDLPAEVVGKAKLCLIDSLSGSLTVGAMLEDRCALALAEQRGAAGRATVIGTGVMTSPSDAAFVNAVAAANTSRSDTHPATASHPGTVVVPAALALAEARRRDGSALIEAVVAGYEIMCRLGLALITPEFAAIFRPTGMIAPTAAAIAAGRAAGAEPVALRHAASLATHTASGLNEWANCGTSELPYHSGFAARNGVDCALLAEAGTVSAPTIIEGRAGLLAGYGALGRAAALTAGLGREFHILDVIHKPAPACVFVQTPSQVAFQLVQDGVTAEDIEAIEIRVSRGAAMYPGCDSPGPVTDRQAAKLSIQFAVASVLAAGGIFDANWRDFEGGRANALAARCKVVIDEALTAAFPAQGCHIAARLRDGRVARAGQADFMAMADGDVVERYARLAAARLGEERSTRAVELIERLETLDDVGELTACLRL
ncbi:MmgE/PrpD family protein [Bordetella petrii]|nr:MmgE/PrpD family protein [Bordetella petrii]